MSTPLLEAASISTMSRLEGDASARQTSHFPQGLPLTGDRQLTARAKILAQLVLPVPRLPVKR